MSRKYVPVEDQWTAEQIIALRKMLGLNQEEFASEIGASLNTVKSWESGRLSPNGTVHKLFDLMHRDAKMLKAALKESHTKDAED